MEHWEFLLQKEGDRSWLPLDSPDVEILEGRYRVVARSSNTSTAIDIRIAHLATEAVPPKRRVQKRSCRTNHDGLMVVIPFTYLEPGLWELCCSPADLMSDLIAGAHPHAVKLQVVAREAEDWEPDWTSPMPTETDVPDIAAVPSTVDHIHYLDQDQPGQPSENVTQDTVAANPNPAATPSIPLLHAEPLSDAVSNDDRRVNLPPEVAEILGASMNRLFQIAEQMSEQLVDDVLQDFDLTTIADAPIADAPSKTFSETVNHNPTEADTVTEAVSNPPAEPSVVPLPSGYTLASGEAFVLTLAQTAFVAARHEVLTLSGQVTLMTVTPTPPATAHSRASLAPATSLTEEDTTDPWEEAAFNLTGASAQELQLYLRDPQSLQVLVSDRQPIAQASFPCSFTFSFSLPDAFSTHLALGEVLLCGTLPDRAEAPIALVTQAFSITVDPNALVGELTKLHEALSTEIEDEERLDLPLELSSRLKEQATPPLDLSFLNWTMVEPQVEQPPRFPSLAGQPLPPQLYQPDPEQSHSRTLNLPAFKLTTEAVPAPEASSTTLEPTTPEPTSQQTTAELMTPSTATEALADGAVDVKIDSLDETTQILSDPLAETSLPDASTTVANDSGASEPVGVTPEETVVGSSDQSPLDLPSPTQMSFQSLKLQDRFLTRLASLATDSELSALLKASLAPGVLPLETTTSPSQADVRSLSEEIVVDDEPPTEPRRRTFTPPAEPPLDEPPNPLILPADDPVPTPILEVTTGELTAGKPINIRVKLPNLMPRIYVKLWITDRQTRSLLDGPRWLVDFLPNGLSELEAMSPLTVPFGSVELRFEAIAVEMHTQRESHKVTVDRVVVPPDLPGVSLDDFDV